MKVYSWGIILIVSFFLIQCDLLNYTPTRNAPNDPLAPVAAPILDPAGGTVPLGQTVQITCQTTGAEIRYNDDGTSAELTQSDRLYVGPITLSVAGTTIVRARAFKSNRTASETSTVSFTVTTSTTPDGTAPTVSATVPVDTATGVAINGTITATFSETMDPTTIVAANYTVAAGSTPVTGTVTYDQPSQTAIFTPASSLTAITVYTATITTGATDFVGNHLAVNMAWTFTTGTAADTTAPTVSSTVPTNTATSVAINSNITATFSEAMLSGTITTATFTLMQGTTAVTGAVTYTGTTATFNPGSDLTYSTVYTATITTGAKDLAGNALASAYVWSFTTGAAADTTSPTVSSTSPAPSATGAAVNGNITATFSEAMLSGTITTATFNLMQGTTAVAGTVSYTGSTATFNPNSDLAYSTLYTATITTGVTDLAGNGLPVDKAWTFTTASAGLGPAPVILGTAGNFAILAKTAISTVPASVITGDVGLSPAAASLMTGFALTGAIGYATSTQVTGFLYAADMASPTPTTMSTAISDMETAYADAAGRVTPNFTDLSTGNIGGLTLVPGLYKWNTTVTIPSDVTISGGATDVWIFQISGDLTVSGAKSVLLSGGALPKNIFWQLTGAANLGTGSHWEGNILCQTSITLGTNAVMNGRALAQTNVALQQATVTKPAP